MAYAYLTPYRRGGGSLFDLHKQMNQMFDELLGPDGQKAESQKSGKDGKKSKGGTSWPSLQIDQDDNEIVIHAELAGMKRDDIEISMDDGMLTLSGEKQKTTRSENGYTEFSHGRFERQVSIPNTVDIDAATAEFEHGLLTITLPKMEEKASGRKIAIADASDRSDDKGGDNKGRDNKGSGDSGGKSAKTAANPADGQKDKNDAKNRKEPSDKD